MSKKNILFIVPYQLDKAPGQRFRFEHYLGSLKHSVLQYTVRPFLDEETNSIIYKPGNYVKKVGGLFRGFLFRIGDLLRARQFEYIYIFREATPVGPPFFEWVVSRVMKKKIIYDFDDAIWLKDPHESSLTGFIKWKSKVGVICKWSTIVTCGNKFLADYAHRYSSDVRILPTVVNSNIHRRKNFPDNTIPTIGWTGSQSTLIYLNEIIPVLRSLHTKIPFNFIIIANVNPDFPDDFISFIPWDKTSEISDLEKIEIGIMPLPDDQWSKGKCGFKLIQYGAMSIPSVASSVGVNPEVIQHGVTGFLCENKEQWEEHLLTLLKSKSLRREMGSKARSRIKMMYSTDSQRNQFLKLFEK